MSILLAAASAVQGFDVEAATQAYTSTLQGAARAKSDSYFEGGYWLILWGALVGVIIHWVMLHFRWSAKWSCWAGGVTKRRWLQPMLYALPFVLAGTLLALPWTVYVGYIREKKYGLMNHNFAGWATEQTIGLAIGIVMTAILLAIIFAVIRKAPRTWWLWGTGAITVFLAFSILIAPVFIAPLFNKYTPMAEGDLREQILDMAHKQDIPADNVYVFDASKQTKRISANVSGLGPTIRISLNDNLLNRSNTSGVKAVMGHEIGHYVLGHVERLLLYFTLLTLVAMWTLHWATPRILKRYGERWGVHDVSDPAVLPVFSMIIAVLGMLATPIVNTIIRVGESEADAFGLEAAREPDGFAMTAMQLSEYRKIEPGELEEILFFDHPSGRTRVRMAMEWKAKHLNELPPEQRGMIVMTSEAKAD